MDVMKSLEIWWELNTPVVKKVTARFAAASAPPHAVAAAEASPVGRQCVCFSAADRVQWRGGVRGEDDTHRQYRLQCPNSCPRGRARPSVCGSKETDRPGGITFGPTRSPLAS